MNIEAVPPPSGNHPDGSMYYYDDGLNVHEYIFCFGKGPGRWYKSKTWYGDEYEGD